MGDKMLPWMSRMDGEISVEEKSDLIVRVTKVSSNGADVTATWDGVFTRTD